LLCAALANDDDVLAIRRVVLIEVAAGEKRNAPRLEVIWRDVVADACSAFIDRKNLAIGARIKEIADRAREERNIGADRRALQAGHIAQRSERLFSETC